jgi:glycosidase
MVKVYSWVPQFVANLLPVGINRDNCRTPMQWNNQKNGGFSSSNETWLPLNQDIERRNVTEQIENGNSLLNVFKNLTRLRKNNAVLHSGTIEVISTGNKNILAYVRSFENEKLLVLINFSKSKITNNINLPVKEVVFSVAQKSRFNGILDAYDGIVLKL